MKRRSAIPIVIILLLLLNAGALALLFHEQRQPSGGELTDDAAKRVGQAISRMSEQVIDVCRKALDDAPAADNENEAAKNTESAGAKKAAAAKHVFVHRGASGEALEHSFEAYDRAIDLGARCIEQDIVISRDGTLFVSHDETASRMTGVDRYYADMSDEEIGQLRTGKGNPVLRLSDVFDRYGSTIFYVIELKSTDQATSQAFIDLIDRYQNSGRVIVQCFELGTLRVMEDAFPDMPKIYLCRESSLLDQGYEAPYVDIIAARRDMMNEENVRRAHELGKQFNSWTLVGESELRRAIDLGVDSYFTDDVELALSLETNYGYEKRNESQ